MPSRANVAQFALAGQFLATVLVCICTALAVVVDDKAAGCIIGLITVQILLSAIWSTMGPASFWFRLSTGAGVTFFLVGCFYRVAFRDGGGHGIAISIAVPMLILWILIQIPLWMSRLQGWRLGDPEIGNAATDPLEFQFGIRQLLIWTAIVAVSIAIIKYFVRQIDTSGSAGAGAIELEFAAHLTIGNSLIALPVIWGAFVNHNAWIWFLISILVCVIVCISQIALLRGAGDYTLLILANVVQTFLSIFAMIVVRMLGYRLIRHSEQA